MGFQLYDWQNRCLNIWFDHNCRGIINVVTGAGKTMLALAAIKQLAESSTVPLKVKIVVPKAFMVLQWLRVIRNQYEYLGIEPEEIGCYYGSTKDQSDKKYMIYVINSARYTLSRHIIEDINHGHSVLMVADECHHYGSEENRKIFEFLDFLASRKIDLTDRYYSLGLSATPQNTYFKSVLVPALGPEIFKYGLDDAIRHNTINPFALFQIALSFSPEEQAAYDDINEQLTAVMRRLTGLCPYLKSLDRNSYFQALQQMAQNQKSDQTSSMAAALLMLMFERKRLVSTCGIRLDCVCHLIQRLNIKSKIIIFGEQIDQIDLLFDRLSPLYPRQIGRYHSAMDPNTRKRILQQYKDGEVRILISCKALDEGLDVPAANVGIILSSTGNQRQRLQRLGRILRKSSPVKDACLYYLYIRGSMEDRGFLDSVPKGTPVLELSYSARHQDFLQHQYDHLATCMLEYWEQKQLKPDTLQELHICLSCGRVRADWLLDKQECTMRLQAAESVHEKNYWFCMKEIADKLETEGLNR